MRVSRSKLIDSAIERDRSDSDGQTVRTSFRISEEANALLVKMTQEQASSVKDILNSAIKTLILSDLDLILNPNGPSKTDLAEHVSLSPKVAGTRKTFAIGKKCLRKISDFSNAHSLDRDQLLDFIVKLYSDMKTQEKERLEPNRLLLIGKLRQIQDLMCSFSETELKDFEELTDDELVFDGELDRLKDWIDLLEPSNGQNEEGHHDVK